MPLFLKIFWVVDLILMAFSVWMLWRNGRVFKLRTSMVERLFKHQNVGWRLKVYHKVSYRDMMWSLKPVKVESFYKSTDFLDAEDEE